MLPLHIFEPRYRIMAQEALEQDIPIVVVKLMEPKRLNEMELPAFHEVGGLGFVMHHQQLPDGRYNILLEGTDRVRVVEELATDKPYRVGRAEVIADEMGPMGSINALMTTLRGCIVGLQPDYERLAEALAKTINNVPNPAALSNTIASIIIADAEIRQQLLEEPRIDRRLEEIITRLTDLLAASSSNNQSGGGGQWLN